MLIFTLAAPIYADSLSSPAGVYQFADQGQALTFHGKGWGHGVGLCQWGARGRANAGQSAEQIVAAYYQGTTVQKAVAPETTIRVLIHSKLDLAPDRSAKITGQDGDWHFETSGTAAIQAPADGYLEISATGSELRFGIHDSTGSKMAEGTIRGGMVLRPANANTRFVVHYKPAPSVPGRSSAYYDVYRGEIVVTPVDGKLDTVNRLSLEDYLRGVVPAEMPALWPAEALKAQTLAARSYAVTQAKNRSAERYDVDDTTQFQVYRGVHMEQANVNQIIDASAGQVIVFGGRIVEGFFFSTCGGWTENNETVWPGGDPRPYLRGIQDVDANGRPFDADSPRFSWETGALTVAQLEAILNSQPATEVGRLVSLDLSRRAPSGRLLNVRITGSAGTKTVRPDTFMSRFNNGRPDSLTPIYSTNLDLKWVPASALLQSQGTFNPPASAASSPQAPAPRTQVTPPPAPTPPAAPTPVYRLEWTQPAPPKPEGPSNRFYPETGHNVGGAFLKFFHEQGGLDLFGFPRTEEILEDGRTVQYFQRARMEFHTDKVGSPYEVQLGLLGTLAAAERPPSAGVPPFASSEERLYFPETGHGLHHAFLKYWRERGGLDVFGYPISEELTEDGFTVQYFQRARFEYHPELPEPYQVSLGLLGDQLLRQRYWLKD